MSTRTAPLRRLVASDSASETKPEEASVVAEPSPKGKPLFDEAIRMCAYRKWEAAGRPSGDGVRFWLDAEKELAQAK